MWMQKMLRVVISSWAIALAVSVVPVHSAGNGGEQTSPEPNSSGGICIECKPN
ncbi:MAG: hypothetical protein GFH27_549281n357 [Chloroflexi bacterium AL-W]|nr:hypothetical protein [Chloroflexi bacterium AL-N1]NOK66242.1 hypothetical protein [Chloroflexi bacterium AL-N10]NOK73123.1 hypothetical protein [Chloroflexi bacterium AL-N5]NOK80020.1 hypothetical protein [Chloroflexi bacterium AL-W]NOK88124.1 hypothetical protein [Chloroflexi bacterium AL-N15]